MSPPPLVTGYLAAILLFVVWLACCAAIIGVALLIRWAVTL